MVNRIEKLMADLPSDIDGALIQAPENRFYFAGIQSSAGFLLVGREKAALYIDFRYYGKATQVVPKPIEVVLLDDEPMQLAAFCRRQGIARMGLEASCTLGQLARLRKNLPGVELVAESGLDQVINGQRRHKSDAEVAAIREAQRITDLSFTHILNYIRPGRSERDIALELEMYSRRMGSEGPAFEFIVASGPNSALPHARAGSRIIERWDWITIDFGCTIEGYHSDMTRTVAVGGAAEEMRKIYHIVYVAQYEALRQMGPAKGLIEIDAVARNMIADAGYGEYFGHSLGHGVGLEVHERPNLSPKTLGMLDPGDVVTVEPGIYLPGRFGCRIEDMVLITDEGIENFTQSDKELLVI